MILMQKGTDQLKMRKTIRLVALEQLKGVKKQLEKIEKQLIRRKNS